MARHLISPAWLEELHTDDDEYEALHLRGPQNWCMHDCCRALPYVMPRIKYATFVAWVWRMLTDTYRPYIPAQGELLNK